MKKQEIRLFTEMRTGIREMPCVYMLWMAFLLTDDRQKQ